MNFKEICRNCIDELRQIDATEEMWGIDRELLTSLTSKAGERASLARIIVEYDKGINSFTKMMTKYVLILQEITDENKVVYSELNSLMKWVYNNRTVLASNLTIPYKRLQIDPVEDQIELFYAIYLKRIPSDEEVEIVAQRLRASHNLKALLSDFERWRDESHILSTLDIIVSQDQHSIDLYDFYLLLQG